MYIYIFSSYFKYSSVVVNIKIGCLKDEFTIMVFYSKLVESSKLLKIIR